MAAFGWAATVTRPLCRCEGRVCVASWADAGTFLASPVGEFARSGMCQDGNLELDHVVAAVVLKAQAGGAWAEALAVVPFCAEHNPWAACGLAGAGLGMTAVLDRQGRIRCRDYDRCRA
jgi:hypothetical protein